MLAIFEMRATDIWLSIHVPVCYSSFVVKAADFIYIIKVFNIF